MDRIETHLKRAFICWIRGTEPPRGMRRRILRQAAASRQGDFRRGYTPDHLLAWNLPGRKSGIADMWRYRFAGILAPYHSGSLKQVM